MLVSCVGQSLPHWGLPKRLPSSKSSFRSSRRGSPANRDSLTFHPASSSKAALNKASGLIPLMLFPLAEFTRADNEALVRYSTARPARLSQNKIICAYPFQTAESRFWELFKLAWLWLGLHSQFEQPYTNSFDSMEHRYDGGKEELELAPPYD